MTATTILATFVFLLAAVIIIKGVRIVRQSEALVIERLGKYRTTLAAGINIIIPIVDRPRDIAWRMTLESQDGRQITQYKMRERVDLRETVFDFPKQGVITKDNVVTEINALIYFQIVDPVKAVYEINNLPNAIEKLTQTTLRNIIGELELDECLSSRDTINMKLRAILDEATNKWGVKVNRVELQDINPPVDIKEAMEKQMRAERTRRGQIIEAEGTKRAAILEAEGQKGAEINQAEGQKQARILEAEGEATARLAIAEAEAEAIRRISIAVADTKADPTQYLIAVRYIETLEQILRDGGVGSKTVFMPYEASGLMGSVGGMKELLNATKD
ncbi:MAG: paraslipin [Flavobacteriales bacterium]|jgi:regulator of protease activity HflC (stomatin/prohibitin superfamily)|nr:paraslipin [Flavobacteriales bacterium]